MCVGKREKWRGVLMYHVNTAALRGQKTVSDPLELELWTSMWVLGVEFNQNPL